MGDQRNAIEDCIKNQQLVRSRFHEVSTQSYRQILRNIEEHFVDKSKSWNKEIHWANMGCFRSDLGCITKAMDRDRSWLDRLPQILPSAHRPVYVLFEDRKAYMPKYWVYESYPTELVSVLSECVWGDVYIVSKKYRWLMSLNHHDILSCVGEGLNLNPLEAKKRPKEP